MVVPAPRLGRAGGRDGARYHNFRRFCCGEEDPGGAFVAIPEVEKAWSSMRLCDYVR